MHTCSCQFVPPFVLDGLKASGDSAIAERVKLSLKESDQLRKRRASGRQTSAQAEDVDPQLVVGDRRSGGHPSACG